MKRPSLALSVVLLAAALLVLIPTTQLSLPAFVPLFGEAAITAPVLLLAPELRP